MRAHACTWNSSPGLALSGAVTLTTRPEGDVATNSAPPTTLLCVAYAADGAECYTGTARGDILVWAERVLLRAVRGHSGPVFSLCAAPPSAAGRHTLLSVGKGGKLRRWTDGLASSDSVDLRRGLAALADGFGRPVASRGDAPVFRSVCADGAGRVLLGTGQAVEPELGASAVDGASVVCVWVGEAVQEFAFDLCQEKNNAVSSSGSARAA